MTMRKLLFICSLVFSLLSLGGCSDDIDSPTLTTDEYPRILGRWPEKNDQGELGVFEIPLDQVLTINVQYTPAELCEGIWYLDEREIHRGVGLEYTPSVEGSFHLKLVVRTATQETAREAIIKVVAPSESQSN